jgi:F-type H+/Na+-transporting ATPase subunit alpha
MQTKLDNVKIPALDIKEIGCVKDVRLGIAKIEGVPSCAYGQLVQFSGGAKGIVMGFNSKEVLAIILGGQGSVSVGSTVSSGAELTSIPVGPAFLNRVVNSLAEPIDGKGEIVPSGFLPVFSEAPGVMEREPIVEPLFTGIKILDLIIPIGKGQRELIIGDRQTGKSSIALEAIMNQKERNVVCIYCWIGGPQTTLKKWISILSANGARKHTIIVSASADTPAAEQYLAPYTAATLGEYFMQQGQDVLVVFDDLTKHAWIYRQMSLLLERPPGREAYPGDIFYLHSQLMERAGKLKRQKGGGSMTFLPIVETLQGDITGYIQTNLISMTDGQVYINSSLFREGFKPAIDLGLSVTRIGSRVQYPAVREVSAGLRLEYTQYREMLRLTKLRTRLSEETLEKFRRGELLQKLFIQPNGAPASIEEQIVIFYAFKLRVLEALPTNELERFTRYFWETLLKEEPGFVEKLRKRKELTPEIKGDLDNILLRFFKGSKSDE